jgi:nucleoside 2-deoxyribosyltransferase
MAIDQPKFVTISGSFRKYKPEIDLAIQEFRDYGFTVLAPDLGWLQVPRHRILSLSEKGFRPLPSEVNMSILEIENRFLNCVRQSNLLYVVNPAGYIGNSAALEVGFAMALGIPVYCQELTDMNLDIDPIWRERMSQIAVASISEVAKNFES